jgi:hypothetical protein
MDMYAILSKLDGLTNKSKLLTEDAAGIDAANKFNKLTDLIKQTPGSTRGGFTANDTTVVGSRGNPAKPFEPRVGGTVTKGGTTSIERVEHPDVKGSYRATVSTTAAGLPDNKHYYTNNQDAIDATQASMDYNSMANEATEPSIAPPANDRLANLRDRLAPQKSKNSEVDSTDDEEHTPDKKQLMRSIKAAPASDDNISKHKHSSGPLSSKSKSQFSDKISNALSSGKVDMYDLIAGDYKKTNPADTSLAIGMFKAVATKLKLNADKDYEKIIDKMMQYVKGKSRDLLISNDNDKKPAKEIETTESTSSSTAATAPAAAPTSSGNGMKIGTGIYDSYNREVESIISETMNISVNQSAEDSGDNQFSVNINAEDDDAMALLDLIKSAGLATPNFSDLDTDESVPEPLDATVYSIDTNDNDDLMDLMHLSGVGGQCNHDAEHVDEELSNSPDEKYADTDFLTKTISGGLNKQHMQVNPNNLGDNPLAMQRLGKAPSGQIQLGEADVILTKLQNKYAKY